MNDTKRFSPKALKARFPYMFEGENIGLSLYRGWLPILVWACEEIDAVLGANKRGFHWTQIKEKFGSGRFYYGMRREPGWKPRVIVNEQVSGDPGEWSRQVITPPGEDPRSVSTVIADIVGRATTETTTACIVCGAAAKVRNYEGRYALLCDAHHPKRFPGGWEALWRVACVEDDDA